MKEYKLTKPYSRGAYNKIDGEMQWIRITEGCPHKHPYCAESFENPVNVIHSIPRIQRNKVKILDMNLLCKKEALGRINFLGSLRVNNKVVYYELTCGIDWRFLTQEIADALKQNRFKNIRLAWDYGMEFQLQVRDAVKMLLKAGYKPHDIMIFMICNWKTPYEDCLQKMDLCKVWNVKIADCWFDNQLSPNIKPIHWKKDQIKTFRKKCRKHNQLVIFKVDPEWKEKKRNESQ